VLAQLIRWLGLMSNFRQFDRATGKVNSRHQRIDAMPAINSWRAPFASN
jgi:hypothetical protein